jgi:hypothetical protein
LLHVLAGQAKMDEPLAGKSTLNRLELGDGSPHRYKKITYWKDSLDALLVAVFLESFETPPEEIVLDLDTTDVELNGKQEGRFFHGYYDEYCYLPLYIFAGEHLLCVRLREADRDAADGCLAEVQRIVEQIRARWSRVHIILRADSGFCRDELMDWAEQQEGVDYVFGVPRNGRLRRLIAPQLAEAAAEHARTGKPARVFTEFLHDTTTGSWARARRLVAKAEHLDGKENPRYVVTSLPPEQWPARQLYEDLYCARGDMENRIKEQFHLFAGRASTETMRANQFRMYLSGMAYVLVSGLRRLGLKATELATAQAATIREKLFKIGARVTVSVSVAVDGIELPAPAIVPAGLGEPALLKRARQGGDSGADSRRGHPPRRSVPARRFSAQLSRRRTAKIPHYRLVGDRADAGDRKAQNPS